MKLFFFCFLAILIASCNGSKLDIAEEAGKPETFTNPLLSSGADPWVIKKDDKYYYTHTTGNKLVLWETSNMENLSRAESLTIWEPPAGENYSHDIWAPEIHYINGKWYMYFAASHSDGTENSMDRNRRMFVLENSSRSPMNREWVFKGKISDETDHWAIDGTVMKIDNEHYFIWSGWRTYSQPENTGRQQLYIAKMTNPWTLEGERVMISEPEYDWERNGLVNEGPVVWKNPSGETFLFYSGSGCWTDDYKLGTIKLIDESDPLNPASWKKYPNPVFAKSEENNVFGPGHNSFFKSPDGLEDWILYHANDNSGDGCGGKRKPRMQKISWDDNGNPVLGVPVSTQTFLPVPSQ